jgi:proline iminopeptidase
VEGGELVGFVRDAPAGRANALILHGGPGMSDYTSSLADEVAALLTTARYQQRGLQPSVVDGDVSVDANVRDAVAVIDALGWQKPVVIGHSWGGYLAMHVAAAHPDRVGALVILDSLGATGDGGVAEFGPNLERDISARDRKRMDELEAIEDATQAERLEHFSYLWPHYFGDAAHAPEMPPFEFSERAAETWESINAHFASKTLEDSLPKVDVPAIVINGDQSPIPLVEGEKIASLLPNATFVVHRGAGHFSWLEEPGFVRNQVDQLLSR